MPKGYWIVGVTVSDEARYPAYREAAQAAYDKFGAKFLVRGGRGETKEGSVRDRVVIVEFADYETALACYDSPEYAAARAIRQSASAADFAIIEGHDA